MESVCDLGYRHGGLSLDRLLHKPWRGSVEGVVTFVSATCLGDQSGLVRIGSPRLRFGGVCKSRTTKELWLLAATPILMQQVSAARVAAAALLQDFRGSAREGGRGQHELTHAFSSYTRLLSGMLVYLFGFWAATTLPLSPTNIYSSV